MIRNRAHKSGFTLIELLVVVAIIGVLTAVLLVNLVGIRERGSDTKKKSDLNQLKNSMRLFYNDFQRYPTQSGSSFVACSGAACSQGSQMNNGSGTVYMKEVPEYSVYSQYNNGDSFYVGVVLDNPGDPDIAASASRCGVASPATNTFYACSD